MSHNRQSNVLPSQSKSVMFIPLSLRKSAYGSLNNLRRHKCLSHSYVVKLAEDWCSAYARPVKASCCQTWCLRTVFKTEDEQDVQIVLDADTLWFIQSYDATSTDIDAQIEQDINTPFDLTRTGPIRACFYHDTSSNVYLLVNVHHIASDGWSNEVFFKDLEQAYRGEALKPLAIQYKDFSHGNVITCKVKC